MHASARGNIHVGHAQSIMHDVRSISRKDKTKCSRFKQNFIHKTREGKVYCNWRGNCEILRRQRETFLFYFSLHI